jgi:hypothetical protein
VSFASLLSFWVALGQVATDPPYIRSRTNPDDSSSACLHWTAGALQIRQNTLGDPSVVDHSEFAAVSTSISNWKSEFDRCSDLTLTEGLRTPSRLVGYRVGADDNENIILFRIKDCTDVVDISDACWGSGTCGNTHDCWEHSSGTIALTTTSYDPHSGRLFDADIEGNAAAFFFTTVDSPPCPDGQLAPDCVAFDVENTFTHEMGHVVGLAHTEYPGSTMNPSAPMGETSKRTIDQGSLSFVCVAYPRSEPATDCLPPPAQISGSISCEVVSVSGMPPIELGCLAWLIRRRTRRLQ